MYNYNPWSQQMQNMMSQMATQNNPQMPLPQPQTVQIPTVHGIEAARNYTLPPSSSAIVMDADDLIFNVIITDSNGIKTLKRYKGVEITEENTQSTTDYVSKTEFKSLADKVNNLSSIINNSNNNNKGDKR
jgi:hypothetical protein